MIRLRSRLSRCALSLLGTVLAVVLVVAGVVVPWFDRNQRYEEEIDKLTDQLGRYQRMLASLPGLQTTLEQIKADPALGSLYFEGETANLAAAALQNRLKQIVEGAGGALVSSQLLPTHDQSGNSTVNVSLRLSCSTEELQEILYKIESARPLLFIDTLSVRSQQRRRSVTGRRGQPPEVARDLSVRVDVYGYLRRPQA